MRKTQRLIYSILIANVILLCISEGTLAEEKESIIDVSLTNSIELSGEWKFQKIEFIDENIVQPDYNDNNWSVVYAPATWEEQGIEWKTGETQLILYRRTVSIPAEWKGKRIGINCWFSKQSGVYVNGIRVEPKGPLFARYSDVTNILQYGKINYIAVTALNEGKLVLKESPPPRLGVLEERLVTKVLQKDIIIPFDGGKINGILFHPAGLTNLPSLILVATAHHGWGVTEPWFDFADELAREGYLSLIVASNNPRLEHILSAINFLSMLGFTDPIRIGIIGADMAAKFAIIAATRDPRIKTVISISSPMVTLDEKISLCPVLFIASEDDTIAALAARKMSKLLLGRSESLIFKGKIHGITFIEERWTATRQAILDWLKKNL